MVSPPDQQEPRNRKGRYSVMPGQLNGIKLDQADEPAHAAAPETSTSESKPVTAPQAREGGGWKRAVTNSPAAKNRGFLGGGAQLGSSPTNTTTTTNTSGDEEQLMSTLLPGARPSRNPMMTSSHRTLRPSRMTNFEPEDEADEFSEGSQDEDLDEDGDQVPKRAFLDEDDPSEEEESTVEDTLLSEAFATRTYSLATSPITDTSEGTHNTPTVSESSFASALRPHSVATVPTTDSAHGTASQSRPRDDSLIPPPSLSTDFEEVNAPKETTGRLGPPPTKHASTPPISPISPSAPAPPAPPPASLHVNPSGSSPPLSSPTVRADLKATTSQANLGNAHANEKPARRTMTSDDLNRSRGGNAQNLRLTYAGTKEEIGLIRLSELARLPMPKLRKDYQVSILVQYSDSSKDVLEYKNRIHIECTASDIVHECVNKTKKKIPGWNAPPDRLGAYELVIPAKTDEDDDIVMDLETPIWKYCFVPGEVARMVMRPKIRIAGARIVLKVRMDRGPLRSMMFHTITPISMVIERIQHKIKGAESRGPPFTGLFVFDNKRGHFLENLNKTIGDYGLTYLDVVQVKRRRLMELCLRDQPKKSLMVPLDLTANVLAEQLHDWLRLDPVDPETLSLVRLMPKSGNANEMMLVLHPTTEVRAFHLSKDDIIQLRRKPPKTALSPQTPLSKSAGTPASGSVSASTAPPSPNESPASSSSSKSLKLQHYSSQPLQHASSKISAEQLGNNGIVETFRIAFAGNTHDSESFGEGALAAGIAAARVRRYPSPKLKPGEVGLLQTIYGVYLYDSSVRVSMLGDVHITNYRLVFSSYSDDTMSDYFVDVPLTTISRVEKTGDKSKPGLKVDCKDFRTLRFHFDRNEKESRRQMRRLLDDCLYPNYRHLFALAYRAAIKLETKQVDGWSIFDIKQEFARLGVGSGDKGSKWRISLLNEHYQYSKTYPAYIVVPASISDEELIPVFKYRSKGRLPALSWFNSRTGASITRCSQPLSGVTKKTSPDDANLINAIKEAQGSADSKLHLLDARPRANAIANMAMGGGFEVMGGSQYGGCDLEFLNIGNIHVMRTSLGDLKSLIESQPYDNSFLARIEASGWLLHVSLVLQGAVKVVEHIQQRHSCVLHCSDGWDRTSQLSSVAMILLDPYYRTTKGFCILIEKEWCSFGHKFANRYGHIATDHVDKNYAHGERAPIFVQFIDCVYQVVHQFPLAFEFTENVLLCILEHLYSCHYGTFLFDSERERKVENLSAKTVSLWTHILDPDNNAKFKNLFYEPFEGVLPLNPTLAEVHVWRAYYRRWYAPPDEDKLNIDEKVRELVEQNVQQAERIAQLEMRLQALEHNSS